MILVDTSVWIDHLRQARLAFAKCLRDGQVLCHPFVIGELAIGHLERRREILTLLRELGQLSMAEDDEVLALIERHRLMGCGIGWIDAHLLTSALVAGVPMWTHDKRLAGVAGELGILFRG